MDNPVTWKNLTSYRIKLLAQHLGMDATYSLLTEFVHVTLYIPRTLTNSELTKKVGVDAANVLVKLWPDQRVTLPKPDKMLNLWRNHEIIKRIDNGDITTTNACIEYDLTRQRINQIRQSLQPETYPEKHPNLTLDL